MNRREFLENLAVVLAGVPFVGAFLSDLLRTEQMREVPVPRKHFEISTRGLGTVEARAGEELRAGDLVSVDEDGYLVRYDVEGTDERGRPVRETIGVAVNPAVAGESVPVRIQT